MTTNFLTLHNCIRCHSSVKHSQGSLSGKGTNFDSVTTLYIQLSTGYHPNFHLWVQRIQSLGSSGWNVTL